MIKIMPDEAVLREWIKHFTYDYDVFYLTEDSLKYFKNHLNDGSILDTKRFLKHTLGNDIKYINHYEFWLMDREATHFLIAHKGWFENLPAELKFRMLTLQLELDRGFIYPEEILSHPKYDDYSLKNKTILTSSLVDHMTHHEKEAMLRYGAEKEEDNIVIGVKKNTPNHIKAVVNSFSTVNGSNCFGATLFAITGDEKYLPEWVHQESFLEVLSENGYTPVSGENRKGDVIVWTDDNGAVRHACYYLGDGLYFNKSGQKIYNPWKITGLRELNDDWNHYKYLIYRK